ncbi:uncharacterized protein B0H64DRAFT_418347 [Chaetomium fimeti]|uniref:Erythromycin biosynthesis protein CIII-like C-terminal domain-containing protein n=1 Tax=Chaetomium fimeti TaxID=1854472 RepID=A0AAE0HDB8_9PEZI|nr:hypothetical protein B0H64DRAFT_418347 [Chaetomium fimeti]
MFEHGTGIQWHAQRLIVFDTTSGLCQELTGSTSIELVSRPSSTFRPGACNPAPKRVLLLTNSEHGQANVFLATSYALLTLEDEDVKVHFASFQPIQSFVSATSDHAQQDKPGARPIVFHTIDGVDMVSAWTRPEIAAEQEALKNRSIIPLVHDIRRTLMVLKVTLPWTGPEFVQIMQSVISIVDDVQPDVIAVDPCFSPALTALRHSKAKFTVLSPNTIKDFAIPYQPNAEALWKYPRDGVVRIVDWLEAEPMAVLETGVVVCAVHHGGANSFLEAVCAGVPQVVLPVWMDTFDFARRAELLGIGRWGNRLTRKLCEEKELGAILTEVVAGEKAPAYAGKAKELAALCKESGGGRFFLPSGQLIP